MEYKNTRLVWPRLVGENNVSDFDCWRYPSLSIRAVLIEISRIRDLHSRRPVDCAVSVVPSADIRREANASCCRLCFSVDGSTHLLVWFRRKRTTVTNQRTLLVTRLQSLFRALHPALSYITYVPQQLFRCPFPCYRIR